MSSKAKRQANDRAALKMIRSGYIKVGSDGQVWRRQFNYQYKSKTGKIVTVSIPAKTLVPDEMNGYSRIKVKYQGVKHTFMLHRLVMLQFHGQSECEVDHIDNVRSNCQLTNLQFIPRKENLQKKGARVYRPTPEEIEELKVRYREGESINSLRIEKGCTWQTMKRILKDEDQRKPGLRRDTTIEGLSLFKWCEKNGIHYNRLLSRRQRYGLDTCSALRMLLGDETAIKIEELQIEEPAPREPKVPVCNEWKMREKGYVTFKEAADALGLSRNVRYKWLKKGLIETVRPGTSVRFVHRDELERLMNQYGRKEAA